MIMITDYPDTPSAVYHEHKATDSKHTHKSNTDYLISEGMKAIMETFEAMGEKVKQLSTTIAQNW